VEGRSKIIKNLQRRNVAKSRLKIEDPQTHMQEKSKSFDKYAEFSKCYSHLSDEENELTTLRNDIAYVHLAKHSMPILVHGLPSRVPNVRESSEPCCIRYI
jgi:hypothetical protein